MVRGCSTVKPVFGGSVLAGRGYGNINDFCVISDSIADNPVGMAY